ELTALLQDLRLITLEAAPDQEYWGLVDAARPAVSRVLGFADLLLHEPPNSRLESYREDVGKIRTAAAQFLTLARESDLLICLETGRHWESPCAGSRGSGRTGNAKGRVLIVDDETLNREVLCRRLQREGYQPTGVRSGREALNLLKEESFDAVLLDILMPEMSGVDVLQEMKGDETLRYLPVIMLSALTDVGRVARCVELGADDYLPKPINAVLLRARLGACLEKKRLRDQEQAHLRALHAEKERLSVTLSSLADAVVTTDEKGRVLLVNEVAAELIGADMDEVEGRLFDEVFRIFDRTTQQVAHSTVAEVLSRGSVVESAAGLAIRARDGAERLVSVRSAPISDQAGGIEGTVVVIRDITEREKMAEELLRASKLQSIGVLAGGLAHDFNNMLTAVLGNLSLVRHRRNLPAEVVPSIQEAENGALRAQELTRYLLTFADGGAPLKQELHPGPLIEETSMFAVRGSDVQCELALSQGLWEIDADPAQLAQVISNVVLNAVEASSSGARIRVEAENISLPSSASSDAAAGDYLRITVKDSGAGIRHEDLPRVFDPFFTTKRQARGLGLAAAYSITQRHGGRITVASELGVGTTITLLFPALRRDTTEQLSDSQSRTPAHPGELRVGFDNTKERRVLVMDDEESICLLVSTMLGELGYDVVTTADGDSALAEHTAARSAGRPFDLAFFDLTIPGGMGGKEAIRRLREVDNTIRVIVSSGYSNDPVMANFEEHGFNGVLPKPYMVQDLIRVVDEVIAA
ncbi:MAG TPA: response regulator, partial [Chthoniobacteraceae bacterium]